MKTSALDKGQRAVDVMRGNVDAAAARSFSWIEEMQNDSGVDMTEGQVVVVLADGTIALASVLNDPRPTGVVVDAIDDGDSGQVVFGGPVDVVRVTSAVTAGQYGSTSATPGLATPSGAGNAFCEFTASGTEPSAFLWGGRGGLGAAITIDNSGGGSTASAHLVNMLNASGQELVLGDVVVVDETNDTAVTVTTTEGDTRIAGVVQETIAIDAIGKVLFNGYTPVISSPNAVRGEYAKTSGTATEATSTTDRESGSFAVYLTGIGLPSPTAAFVTDSVVTTTPDSVEALSIAVPTSLYIDRVLFLALWFADSVSSIDIPGWTRIGSDDEFTYFYRISTGVDLAEATWTGPTAASAVVMVLEDVVSNVTPIEDHDYDNTTSAASVSGLSDAPRYAVAAVAAAPAVPAGWTQLGVIAGGVGSGEVYTDTSWKVWREAYAFGTLDGTPDAAWKDWDFDDSAWSSAVDATDGQYVGYPPAYPPAVPIAPTLLGSEFHFLLWHARGTFTLTDLPSGAVLYVGHDDDITVYINGTAVFSEGSWPGNQTVPRTISVAPFRVGTNAIAFSIQNYTGNTYDGNPTFGELRLVFSDVEASGMLVGKYIGHDASVTSPFSGADQQDDAIFVFNLLADARPSALLYGPDLGGTSSFSGVAEDLTTAETDTTLVLHPDGAGGIEWGVDATGGSGSLYDAVVTDYGAVGDDTTDDTAAIQAAMDAVPDGGTCFFPTPPSKYKITAPLTRADVDGGIRLLGAGTIYGQTTIRQATANTDAFTSAVDVLSSFSSSGIDNSRNYERSITIENLRFEGPTGGTNAATGAGIYALADLHLRDVTVYGFAQGIYPGAHGYFSSLDRVRATAATTGALWWPTGNNLTVFNSQFWGSAYGIYAADFLSLRVRDCVFEQNTTAGLEAEGKTGSTTTSRSLVVDGCFFEETASGIPDIVLGRNYNLTAAKITDNIFIANAQGDTGASWHIDSYHVTQLTLDTNRLYGGGTGGGDIRCSADTQFLVLVNQQYVAVSGLPARTMRVDPNDVGFQGPLATLREGSAPSTPASNFVALYAKTDGLLYSKDDAGAETPLGGSVSALDDLSDVTITSPTAGEMVRWDGAAWINDAGYIPVDTGTPTYDTGSPPGVTMTTKWGVDSGGLPYYDTANAAAGEEAALFYDPLTAHYFLIAYDF